MVGGIFVMTIIGTITTLVAQTINHQHYRKVTNKLPTAVDPCFLNEVTITYSSKVACTSVCMNTLNCRLACIDEHRCRLYKANVEQRFEGVTSGLTTQLTNFECYSSWYFFKDNLTSIATVDVIRNWYSAKTPAYNDGFTCATTQTYVLWLYISPYPYVSFKFPEVKAVKKVLMQAPWSGYTTYFQRIQVRVGNNSNPSDSSNELLMEFTGPPQAGEVVVFETPGLVLHGTHLIIYQASGMGHFFIYDIIILPP